MPGNPRTPQIWFCATGKTGLGHLRRVSTIAKAITMRRGEPDCGLVTNGPLDGLEQADRDAFSVVVQTERSAMANAVGTARTVVVDTAVIDGIDQSASRLALILRETGADRQNQFRLPGERLWDLVLVPNPAAHWQPEVDLGIRTEAVGWIYRQPSKEVWHPGNVPEVLVATGGGGNREIAERLRDEIDGIILEARSVAQFQVSQATGPRVPDAGRLTRADRFFDPGGSLHQCFSSADAVITTAGYNSILELAALDVPALIMPIERTIDDQAARARLWGPLIGRWHETRTRSAAWLARVVCERQRRPPVDLGPSGEGRAAELILELSEQ